MHLLLLASLLFAPPSEADPPSGPAVSAPANLIQERALAADSFSVFSMRYAYDWVSDREPWHRRNVTYEAFLSRGTVVATLTQQRRFGRNEVSGEAHYWADLWGDSYAHVHASLAPRARAVPQQSVGGELYEVVQGWEFSGWYEWRRYSSGHVHILGPQIARYLEGWYLRARTSILERDQTWSVTQILAARRYLGTPTTFVEGQVGFGRTIELVRPDLPPQVSRTFSASVRLRRFVTPRLGVSVAGRYNRGLLRRSGLSAGLLVRW